jgi:hypothetical protein
MVFQGVGMRGFRDENFWHMIFLAFWVRLDIIFGTSALRHVGTSALHNCVTVSDASHIPTSDFLFLRRGRGVAAFLWRFEFIWPRSLGDRGLFLYSLISTPNHSCLRRALTGER